MCKLLKQAIAAPCRYWLKATCDGRPAVALDNSHRHPYEVLLLLRRDGSDQHPWQWPNAAEEKPQGAEPAPGEHEALPAPPPERVIVAVPGAHSRKPHLGPLLEAYAPAGCKRLELFARELHAGWSSWGNEVLRFQEADLFCRRQDACAQDAGRG